MLCWAMPFWAEDALACFLPACARRGEIHWKHTWHHWCVGLADSSQATAQGVFVCGDEEVARMTWLISMGQVIESAGVGGVMPAGAQTVLGCTAGHVT